MKVTHRKIPNQNQCCICGLRKCSQATDHSYLSLYQLKSKIENAKVPNKIIDQLKQKTNQFYRALKQQIDTTIDRDHKKLQQHLNKFYFWHLNQEIACFDDLCQIANGCYDKLPSKRALRVVNSIQNNRKLPLKSQTLTEIEQLKQQLQKSFQMNSINKQLQKLKTILPYSKSFQHLIPELKLKKSTSDYSNPEQLPQPICTTYLYKNVQITQRSKTIQLNNKNLTDQQLLKQMPKLSSFKNVQQFQIRNNKITLLSCKLICTNMQHVKSIDIRGNQIGDQGVIWIAKGMPGLKSFMISQTGCTSASLRVIVQGMKNLEKLWCQSNKIDGQTAYQVANMPTLRILSFIGCNLQPQIADKIKKLFHPKGYVSI